jgi:hypothetical protein
MYLDGSRLGDDLTDNAYLEDGYRFHDVMHLAFAAKLGWSPVLRKLLGRKRRGDARIDEVEDGARAGIVEEAVINAIHAEGVRLAALMARRGVAGPRLFPNRADMSFAFLKRVEALVAGLEVQHHRYWEWEDAILEGFRIFEQLRASGRGTIALDLNTRSISFDSKVFADVAGSVVALGTASVPLTELVLATDDSNCVSLDEHAEVRRLAVLDALGLENVPTDELMIGGWRRDIVDVITDGSVKSAIWDKGIVTFRISVAQAAGCIIATCLAIGDKP